MTLMVPCTLPARKVSHADSGPHRCSGVKDGIAARRGGVQRTCIGEIALYELATELSHPVRALGTAHERAHGAPALDESLHEVRAEHSGGAGHQRASHAGNMR